MNDEKKRQKLENSNKATSERHQEKPHEKPNRTPSEKSAKSRTFRVSLGQLAPTVGDFIQNEAQIIKAYERACSEGARVLLTPELSICGYPPLDLVERPEFIDEASATAKRLAEKTRGLQTALVVGLVTRNEAPSGREVQNSLWVLENGEVVFRQAKCLLPTYDVFDEARYFAPGGDLKPWDCDGLKVGFGICEDFWAEEAHLGRKLYGGLSPAKCLKAAGAEILLSLSASPFEVSKHIKRESLHASLAKELQVPLAYVNQVGATDEIVFDGGSFFANSDGNLIARLGFFEEGFATFECQLGAGGSEWSQVSPLLPSKGESHYGAAVASASATDLRLDHLTKALVLGIRDYWHKSGCESAVIGLSGGIDSAVVATLATQAIGAKNVLGVAMPSQFSSSHSLEDAEILAQNLKIPFEVRPIKFLNSAFTRELSERRGTLNAVAAENLQARLRGVVLMTLSNHYGAMVVTTGNKSEIAMGYCTLYGDMCGALAPIGDLYKTEVYELARYLNLTNGGLIPERSITKAPSAELRPNQTDQESLPPYEVLDHVLREYLENRATLDQIEVSLAKAKLNLPREKIREVLTKVELNEFKRRQAAPVIKVSRKAFGVGRRMPLSKKTVVR